MTPGNPLLACTGFQWDSGNSMKNWERHGVTPSECEEAFLNTPVIVADDQVHSKSERRFHLLGRTDEGRRLMIAFTARRTLVRVVSARDMSRKERRVYEQL